MIQPGARIASSSHDLLVCHTLTRRVIEFEAHRSTTNKRDTCMNRSTCRFAMIASVVLSASAFAPMGCSSSSSQAVERSEKTVDSLANFKSKLTSANLQLSKTMTALDTVLAGSGDPKAAFSTFSKELETLRGNGADAKERAETLQKRSKEYVAKWEAEVSTVSDPALKAQADARRANVKERIDEVQATATTAGNAYRPLMKELTDIQTVLANDLTAANIQGVAPVAAKARENAATLKTSIDKFIAEIDNVMAGIGPRAGA